VHIKKKSHLPTKHAKNVQMKQDPFPFSENKYALQEAWAKRVYAVR
jgi:hypothetical protein